MSHILIPTHTATAMSHLWPDDMGDDGSGRMGFLPTVRNTVNAFREFLGRPFTCDAPVIAYADKDAALCAPEFVEGQCAERFNRPLVELVHVARYKAMYERCSKESIEEARKYYTAYLRVRALEDAVASILEDSELCDKMNPIRREALELLMTKEV